MKELDEQTRQRISNARVMYDEKLHAHFLFFAFDGEERRPSQLPYLMAAKYRDGKMDVMEVVAQMNPWLYNKSYMKKGGQDGQELTDTENRKTEEPLSDGKRLMNASGGVLKNMGNSFLMLTAWISEIARRLWNDDTTGAYKEFAKGVAVVEDLVQRGVKAVGMEAGIARTRSYLIAAFDASVDALKGDFEQARLSARPLTSDLRRAGDVMFVQTGVVQMMQNLSGRMNGTVQRTDPKVSLFAETMQDAKSVAQSEPVQKTVNAIIEGMERLAASTRMDNPEVQKQNRMPEDRLETKHDRLSDVHIYTSKGEMFHYVRCKIDGVQQSSKELRHQDFQLYELGQLDRFQLAEKYYAEDMHRARVAGLGR